MSQPAQPSKAALYVKARQEGLGAREAARRAGYAHGVPSATARRLWSMVQALKGQPELRSLFQRKATEQRARQRSARQWTRAISLVAEGAEG